MASTPALTTATIPAKASASTADIAGVVATLASRQNGRARTKPMWDRSTPPS